MIPISGDVIFPKISSNEARRSVFLDFAPPALRYDNNNDVTNEVRSHPDLYILHGTGKSRNTIKIMTGKMKRIVGKYMHS